MDNDKLFRLKAYYKSELGMLYFPDCTKRNAAQNLKRWIMKCTELSAALADMGYVPTRKFYTRREVEMIVKYLGEP